MNCPACATSNPDNALYCIQCAEPLTSLALALQRKKGLREKKSLEIELTENVAQRLFKWSKLLGSVVTVLTLIFSLLLGNAYLDLRKDIQNGKRTIQSAVKDGNNQISDSIRTANSNILNAQKQLPHINSDIQRLNSDIGKYKVVDNHIEKLQSDLMHLKTDVVDLGHKTLKAESFEETGSGPGMFSFGVVGCSSTKAKNFPISICAEGAPLALNSMTRQGEPRPVASFSSIGFQDVSTLPKPSCNEKTRGTFYIQKGPYHQGDKPFVCIKSDLDSYVWLQITTSGQSR
jgi:hypothetical protein